MAWLILLAMFGFVYWLRSGQKYLNLLNSFLLFLPLVIICANVIYIFNCNINGDVPGRPYWRYNFENYLWAHLVMLLVFYPMWGDPIVKDKEEDKD